MHSTKIKQIYTFGTSHTAGGGFEWHSKDKEKVSNLEKVYGNLDIPKTQFDFSWPGQLSKLANVNVKNYAKSGYGDERMYRKFYEIISKKNSLEELSSSLFIFEFSMMGRKEYYSNTIGDYIIFNYWAKTPDGNYFHDYTKYNENNIDFNLTNDYDNHDNRLSDKSVIDSISNYFKKSWEPDVYHKKVSQDAIHFLAFLKYTSVNYLILNKPFLTMDDYDFFHSDGCNVAMDLETRSMPIEFYNIIDNNSILKESNGVIHDGHAGFKGNSIIAKKVHEYMNQEYIFDTFKYL